MDKLRWGIIGTGFIATAFTEGVRRSESGTVIAVASRNQAKAEEFARWQEIPQAHGTYEALLGNSEVEAVYIATPHPQHREWAIRAAQAGKHILCEKPIGLNYDEAVQMIRAAKENRVFFMEAYMYRCHPQIARVLELIRNGAIGEVRTIRASFGFEAPYDPAGRLFNKELGGGGILDVGGYCTSMARLIAGAALGKSFEEPERLSVSGHLGAESGVDEYAEAQVTFPGGITAMISCGLRKQEENTVHIEGTRGSITLPDPWVPALNGGESSIVIERKGHGTETVTVTAEPLYALEADLVAHPIARGDFQAASPAMSWADTLGNIHLQEQWRLGIDAPAPFSWTAPVAQPDLQM